MSVAIHACQASPYAAQTTSSVLRRWTHRSTSSPAATAANTRTMPCAPIATPTVLVSGVSAYRYCERRYPCHRPNASDTKEVCA
eukprot:scaffold35858_cov62-Phaeocystis_antarctica.AAC.1